MERRLLLHLAVKHLAVKSAIAQLLILCATVSWASASDEGDLVWLRAQDARGRAFDLSSVRGQVVAVTFASRWTREEADRVHAALARRETFVVNVIDFGGIPSLFHGYARRKAAEHDQPGRVHHVLDERGELRRRFGVDPQRRVDILVIDREGSLRGRFAGAQEIEDALRLVDELH